MATELKNDIYYQSFGYIIGFQPEDIPEFSIDDPSDTFSFCNEDNDFFAFKKEESKNLKKRAPIANCNEYIQFEEKAWSRSKSIDAETASNSTNAGTVHEISAIIQRVITMIEDSRLVLLESSLASFGLIERLFVANVVYLRSGVQLPTSQTAEEFVQGVNEALQTNKGKRKDDRLRFIYKRGVKVLLARVSNYQANKTHRMEDYSDQFMRHYFASCPSLTSEALNTSFASSKKLTKLFRASPLFKQDFISHALNDTVDYYSKYSLGMYVKMHEYFLKQVVGSGNCSHDCLQLKFKRIPWSSKDLKLAIDLIHRLDH